MHFEVRRTASVVAGVAMAAGIVYLLVADTGAGEPPAPPPPETTETATPTPEASATPTAEPPPELDNTGEDFDAIWRSIERYRVWLARNPDPYLLKRIYHPACTCYEPELRLLERFRRRGWRFDGPPTETLSVEVIDRPAPHVVLLRVIDRHDPQRVIDSHGSIVRSDVGWPKILWALTLHRDRSGRWRLRDSTLEDRL